MKIEISIVIVNWNSKEYLRRCLQSVYAHTRHLSLEVIVVDSASHDGCGEMLTREFPEVHFIQSETNIGFAKANNLGFLKSRGDVILFLNPDTELVGPSIETLHNILMQLNNPGIVGARLLNADHSLQMTTVQAFPTILNQILDAEVLRQVLPRLPLWGIVPLYISSSEPIEVQAISGACMMIRRSTFERIGKFGEEYFMYSEDVDLCYRCHKAGLKNYFVSNVEIIHHGGGSSSLSPVSKLSNVMLRESRWRFFKKNNGRIYAFVYRISMAFMACIRIGVVCLVWIPSFLIRGKVCFAKQIRKWFDVLRWSIGLESWSQNPLD